MGGHSSHRLLGVPSRKTRSIALLILALAAYGDSTPRNLNSLVEQGENSHDRIYLARVTMQPWSGEVFIPNSSDSTRVSGRGFLVNGRRDGVWTEYFRGGPLKSEVSYVAGILEGPWVEYH